MTVPSKLKKIPKKEEERTVGTVEKKRVSQRLVWFSRVVDLIEGPGASHTRAEELHEVWKHSTATQSCF